MSRPKKGLTLVELLVTIGITTVVVGMLLPAIMSARESARRKQCQNHMRELALGLHNYHDVFKVFPSGFLVQPVDILVHRFAAFPGNLMAGRILDTNVTGAQVSGVAWGMVVTPFVEYGTIFPNIYFGCTAGLSPQWFRHRDVQLIEATLTLFTCPSAGEQALNGQLQSSRGCPTPSGCSAFASQGGQNLSASGGWPAQPASNVITPINGDLNDRTMSAAVSNYLGNSGSRMQDGQMNDGNVLAGTNAPPIPSPSDFGGVLFERSRIKLSDITDGASNTALIAEHTGSTCLYNASLTRDRGTACYAYWATADSFIGDGNKTTVASDVVFSSANGINGGNNVTNTGLPVGIPGDISSLHQGGAQVALCDGSVRFFNTRIDAGLLQSICQRNDGQVFTVPDE